ncbi:tetratricopeptide repeat protein [Apibacter sp. HY039]|uniref:ATP-binding protein n=1 Tax=Apibacter sp. HY039 TaxID=2501476 RepID=UPI0013E39D31|nr:tetratricopeptide repeat protein [Apibacter sp. HY039]
MKKSFIISPIFCLLLFFLCIHCKDKNPLSLKNTLSNDNEKVTKYNDSNFRNSNKDIEKAKKSDNTTKLGQIYFQIGHYFLNKNINDSAYFYFNHAKEIFIPLRDSSYTGKSLLNMAICQANEGDYYGSEETAVDALRFLKSPKDDNYIASVYNTLAICKTEQKNYSQAIEYYQLSLNATKTKFLELNIKNNQAVVNIKAKEYDIAIQLLNSLNNDSIFLNEKSEKYISLKARIEDNLSYAQWLNDPGYDAAPEMFKALKIRENINDLSGQIANHSHLTDYFTKKNISLAIFHAKKMYEIAKKSGTPDDQLEALNKLINLENPVSSKKYFTAYISLNDSLQTERNYAKNQFALIRYEVGKNKEENLKLKAENAQKNYQILRQKVIAASITGVTIMGLVFFLIWFKRRQERFEREKLEEVHRTELKYSKKIHDEVANGIYYLMVQLENNPSIKVENINNNLEELYNRSRNISHESELKTDMKNDYSGLLKDMLQPYGTNNLRIIIIGNDEEIWEKLSIEKREEIYYILIELMTNMKKHSKASLITLKFKKEYSKIFIEYFDNGIGLDSDNWKPGRGVKNMENRINSVQGKIYFDTDNKKGTSIKITITT